MRATGTIVAGVALVAASIVGPAVPALAQSCGGGSSGGFSDHGVQVGASDHPCRPVSIGGGSGYYLRRTVRAEPTLCPPTPDGLQEVLRYYLAGTTTLVRTVTRCIGPVAPADRPPPPPPPPSAISVFREAPLVAPEVHVNPAVTGLVGVETWLWWGADPTVAPLEVSAGGWSASVTIDAPTLVWDLGNGDVRTAHAPGTGPHDPSLRYVYQHPCDCTITLTTRWTGTVTLTHPLATEPIVRRVGPVDLTATTPYAVEAREAVVVG